MSANRVDLQFARKVLDALVKAQLHLNQYAITACHIPPQEDLDAIDECVDELSEMLNDKPHTGSE